MTAGSVRQVSAAQWLHTTAPLWRLPQEGGELAAMLQPATWIVLLRLPALRPCWSASAAWCRAARARARPYFSSPSAAGSPGEVRLLGLRPDFNLMFLPMRSFR
ncbi:MAG: hypothetical protein EPO53_13280 [Variovorax sp.]|nr:MAG: hypothetical protein EPO53_13280 [Variovorax sp.]